MKGFARISCAALLGAMIAGGAAAKPPIRDVDVLDDGVLVVGIAWEIHKECPVISARIIRGIARLRALQKRAYEMGYSTAEIEAYKDSKAEKARLRKRGEAYIRASGFDPKSQAGLCELGRKEIERGSAIGSLLRES